MGKKMLSRDDKILHNHVLWPKRKLERSKIIIIGEIYPNTYRNALMYTKKILSNTYIKLLNVKDESFAASLQKRSKKRIILAISQLILVSDTRKWGTHDSS